MTEDRLREMAGEAELSFASFLMKARRAFSLSIKPTPKLLIELIEKCNEVGDDEAENAIAQVL